MINYITLETQAISKQLLHHRAALRLLKVHRAATGDEVRDSASVAGHVACIATLLDLQRRIAYDRA